MNAITFWTETWEREGFFMMGVSAVLSCVSVDMLIRVIGVVI